ncbi:MAG: UbiD family decarboxylase, partial [Planctomycetes bacterium]|nr:UbiD family decarboxylase [Planctomycetota bacterium]
MHYERLTDFLEELERDGELVRIRCEVDPELEITEITDRMSKSRFERWGLGGPALFFEKVKG